MAISAQLQVANACLPSGTPANFVLTLTNTGSAAVNVQTLQVTATSNVLQNPNISYLNKQIPANGSLSFPFSGAFYTVFSSQEMNYQVIVTAFTDDGSVTASNPVLVSVSTTAEASSGTLPGAFPLMPVLGQLRFESNLLSAMTIALGF